MRESRSTQPRLDDDFAPALPFSLMAALQDGAELEFRTLRRILRTERLSLTGAISVLEHEGHVAVRRVFFGEVPGTWVFTTGRGRMAFDAHLQALRAIVADAHAGR